MTPVDVHFSMPQQKSSNYVFDIFLIYFASSVTLPVDTFPPMSPILLPIDLPGVYRAPEWRNKNWQTCIMTNKNNKSVTFSRVLFETPSRLESFWMTPVDVHFRMPQQVPIIGSAFVSTGRSIRQDEIIFQPSTDIRLKEYQLNQHNSCF